MPHRPTILLAALAIATLVMGGCVAAGSPVPSASASPAPVPSGDPTAFYLRAWTTQAVAPESAFQLAPRLAISNGLLVDTAVAIPAIYPGPLLVEPFARPISDRGIAVIEDSLRSQGLLVTRDFSEGTAVAGGATAHLQVVVGGNTYELSGDPSRIARCVGGTRCVPEPGTAEAFAAFWQQLTGDPGTWLGSDLGAEVRYEPERLAVLAMSPVEVADGPIQAGSESWPLGPFSTFGLAYAGSRCGVVGGPGLESLLPVLRRSNQLTHFTDATGAERSLVVRVLLPGEPDPCTGSPDGGHAPSPSPAAPSGLVPSSTGPATGPAASGSAVSSSG